MTAAHALAGDTGLVLSLLRMCSAFVCSTWLAIGAGCGGDTTKPDAAITVFEFHAWANWEASYLPQVTSVVIDGFQIGSGTGYQVDEWFRSYDVGLTDFVPRTVTVTTGSGSVVRQIAILGDCPELIAPVCVDSEGHGKPGCPGLIVLDEIDFWVSPSSVNPAGVDFYAVEERCTDSDDRSEAWVARRP